MRFVRAEYLPNHVGNIGRPKLRVVRAWVRVRVGARARVRARAKARVRIRV